MTSLGTNPGDLPAVLPGGAAGAVDPFARAYDMPCTLVLEVPAIDFKVGDLMCLRPGSIVRTSSQQNEDLVLNVNGELVGVVELDVVGERLAVRILGMA